MTLLIKVARLLSNCGRRQFPKRDLLSANRRQGTLLRPSALCDTRGHASYPETALANLLLRKIAPVEATCSPRLRPERTWRQPSCSRPVFTVRRTKRRPSV